MMRTLCFWFMVWTLWFQKKCLSLRGDSFTVESVILSPWSKTTRLSQALEFVHDVQKFQILECLKLIARDLARSNKSLTSHECEDKILENINSTFFQSPFTGPLMGLAVENKYYSGRIESMRAQEQHFLSPFTYKAPGCNLEKPDGVESLAPFIRAFLCVPVCDSNHRYKIYALCTRHDFEEFLEKVSMSSTVCRSESTTLERFQSPCEASALFHPLQIPSTMSVPFVKDLTQLRFMKEDLQGNLDLYLYPMLLFFSSLQVTETSTMAYQHFFNILQFLETKHSNLLVYFSHGYSPEVFLTGNSSTFTPEHLSGYGFALSLQHHEYSSSNEMELNPSGIMYSMESENEINSKNNNVLQQCQISSRDLSLKQRFQDARCKSTDIILSRHQIKLLGAKAVTWIDRCRSLKSSSCEGCREELSCLFNISSNFPQEVSKISQITASSRVLNGLKRNYRLFGSRTFVLLVNNLLMQGIFPGILHVLKAISPFILSLESLRRGNMTLRDAVSWIEQVSVASQEVAWGPTGLEWEAFPTRLDWRFTISSISSTGRLPFPSVFDFTTHPVAMTWETLPFQWSSMASRQLLKTNALMHYILIIINPLNPAQVASAISFLGLEIPMVLYILPRASACYSSFSHQWNPAYSDFIHECFAATSSLNANVSCFHSQCFFEQVVGSMFLHLLPFEPYSGKIKTVYERQKIQKKIRRALKFLQHVSQKNTSLTLDIIMELFLYHEGKDSIGRQIIQRYSSAPHDGLELDWAFKVSSYLNTKGLVPNLVVVNGKLFPLHSLVPQQVIKEKAFLPFSKPKAFGYAKSLIRVLLADQQKVVSAMETRRYTFPNEAGYLYLKKAVPTCALREREARSTSLFSPLCIYYTVEKGWKRDTQHLFDPWTIPSVLQDDSLAYRSRLIPFVPSNLLDPFPFATEWIESNNSTPATSGQRSDVIWPLQWTVVTELNTNHGRRIFLAALQHFILILKHRTPLIESTKEWIQFIPRFQWIFLRDITKEDDPLETLNHLYLESLVECILLNTTSSAPFTLTERFSLLHQLLEMVSIQITKGLLNSVPHVKQLLFLRVLPIWRIQIRAARLYNSSIVTFEKAVEIFQTHLSNCPTTTNKKNSNQNASLKRLIHVVHRYFSMVGPYSRVMPLSPFFILNSRLLFLHQYVLHETDLVSLIGLLELLCLKNELYSLNKAQIPSWVHRRNASTEYTRSYPSIGTGSIVVILTDNSTALDLNLSILAGRIFQQLAMETIKDPLFEKIFNQADSFLKITLPRPVKNLFAPLRIHSLMDPVSFFAQQWIPLLDVLNRVLNIEIFLLLNPSQNLSDYPLKRWFRQAIYFPNILNLSQQNPFSNYLSSTDPLCFVTSFDFLTTNKLLMLEPVVPQSWLVRTWNTSGIDLDHIRPSLLTNLNNRLKATFVLTHLVLEGVITPAYIERIHKNSIRTLYHVLTSPKVSIFFLQYAHETLTLFPSGQALRQDDFREVSRLHHPITPFMEQQNIAYFQFLSSPGLYTLQVISEVGFDRPQLRLLTESSFHFANLFFSSTVFVAANSLVSSSPLSLLAFQTSPTSLVSTKPTSVRSRLRLFFFKLFFFPNQWAIRNLSTAQFFNPSECTERVHIFSLASGLLYERLLRFMILSVRKHTTCPLTFWLLDHFLTPDFRLIMERLATRFHVDYRYVSYKWPFILRKQSQRQKIVWANKILFLDVLFPASLKRIIYIDADQIIRGDIHQLWRMNLENNVYGFVEMCASNDKTKDYRFWKGGYWKHHLRGKPYFMSALFVVDLVQFKRKGAGNLIRTSYTALSGDPHSLANLDQDLVNYLQHELPIFQLPSEWLWCETWCSYQIFAKAKAIDLCNNPLTKEPKLSQAFRIIPEIETYDQIIRSLEEEIFQNLSAPSGNRILNVKR